MYKATYLAMLILVLALPGRGQADFIFHNGKVVTVDTGFRVAEAVSVRGERIAMVGQSAEVLAKERGPRTRVIDLKGRMMLPGLIDAHVHALDSGLSEFREKLPPFDSIAAIQAWVKEKAKSTPKGAWIIVPRTLPPRLEEMRFPNRHDLDVAPEHRVAFDGSYVWGANTLALKQSGITRDTPNPAGGEIVKGDDGEPNGILRNAAHLLKGIDRKGSGRDETERLAALERMLELYRKAGLTSIGDRAVTPDEVRLFERLKKEGRLPVRVVLTWRINAARPVEEVVKEIRQSEWTTNKGDEWLKMGSFKVTLDGGQSVGTAYQRMPYGPFGRQLYGQTDPDARGTLFVDPPKLLKIFSAARDKGWQLTAHVQGGAAIDTLLDALEALDTEKPIRASRSHIMHGSFMSAESIERMKRLGVIADVQAAWMHFDTPALERVFGYSNMRYFFPLKTMIDAGIPAAGGSDHMMGHDKRGAVNPFDPFLSMWMAITRKTARGKTFYAEERINREQALRMYTTWAAYLQFSEKEKGSIEAGKLADLVVIDRDYLTCPEDEIKAIDPVMVMIGGRMAEELSAPESRRGSGGGDRP